MDICRGRCSPGAVDRRRAPSSFILTLLLASTAATSTATWELSSLSEPEGGIALLQRLAMLFGQM
jgi:hypothetical protein